MDATRTKPGSPREDGGTASSRVVAVLVPLPLENPYDYAVPAGTTLEPGHYVRVPLGPREVTGVVWGTAAGDVPPEKLRPVAEVLDPPPMPAELRGFLDWMAAYTLAPRGAVLRLALSMPEALRPPMPRVGYVAATEKPPRMTAARRRVLAAAASVSPLSAAALARRAEVSPGVVKALADAGALRPVALDDAPFALPDAAAQGFGLTPPQTEAAASLRASGADRFSVSLLDGVTGAGKTEVYLDAVAGALRRGRQALVLVPEIALTVQWLDRFRRRFGVAPAEWHSELSQSLRRKTWRAVATGAARVVVGARSALFLPFPELGLVVVDEEHDSSYKQEEGVTYHARDMAVVRGRFAGIPVVLVSATPSLESLTNAQSGRYRLVHLTERHGVAGLPRIEAVDLRAAPPPRGRWISPPVEDAVAAALADGKQALLFLNRRGYAPLTLCRTCGHRFECPNCRAWLVEHRFASRLECHHCGYAVSVPGSCPACGRPETLAACGPGVERLAEETAALFPEARVAVMASDTLTGPSAAAEFVQAVAAREVDVVIGTQVAAKGHHFPHLTVVAVVDADLGLAGGDLRAAERTYQLLNQVAGRAGRAEHPGRVLLQTHAPDHPVMAALLSGDRGSFYAQEAADRRARGLPPFGRLVALIVSGTDGQAVEACAHALARAVPSEGGIDVLGPAPAPLAVLRGRTRQRLLVKGARQADVWGFLRRWLARVRPPSAVRIQVDVDPVSFV